MKKIAGSFIVFGFLLAFPVLNVHAQKTFEGTITWSMTLPISGDEDPHPMIINIKGQKSEMSMDMGPMGNLKTYTDYDAKKTYMVQGNTKNGYIIDMPSDSGMKKMGQTNFDSINLKPTGNKETIAGHPAEEYLLTGIKTRGTTVDMSIWVAGDFPKDIQESLYRSLKNSSSQDPKQMKAMKELADKGLVPVRMVMKQGGEVAMTMEFVKFEQKNLDNAIFVPPADVTFSPMPKMPGGMN